MINWNKYCSHIYYIHLQNSNEETFINTLKSIGLYNTNFLSIDHYEIDKNFNDYKYFKYIKVLDCIIDAYYNNYDNIIIFRDDLLFENEKIINNVLDECIYKSFAILNPEDICEDALLINKQVIQYIYHHFFNYNIYKEDNWNIKFWKLIKQKFNIYIPKQSICHHKIDYIIPYVNDTDPEWQKKFNEYYSNYSSESYNRQNRWNNFNNFIYTIRSVAKNMPWINNLFIIVESETQIPKWLIKDNIKIVYHKDFIPEKFLPTYNSCTIESFLYNIKELSEYFIYSNDDIFILKLINKNDFFENGKTKNNLINTNVDKKNHYKISNNSFNLINSEFNKKFNIAKRCIHTPHAMIKSHCIHVAVYHKYNKDKIYNSITRFRNDKNVNQYMYVIYELMIGNNLSNNLNNIFIDINDVNLDINKIFNEFDLLCIKDSYVYNHNELDKLNNKFKKIFNEKSIYDNYDEIKIIKDNNKKENAKNMKYNVALCAIAKNENLYIREWVEYYKKLGINKIFLYDNNDINGERFEEVLQSYIDKNFVEIIDKRGVSITTSKDDDGQTLQGLCFQDCYDNHYKEYDWICFFDIDEFLELSNKLTLDDFFNLYTNNKYDGIRIQWKVYGDNNLLYYHNESIYKRFYNKKNVFNSSLIKTILKGKTHYKKNLLFCAHGPIYISGKHKMISLINLDYSEAFNPYRNIFKLPDNLPAYLNHFFCKSTEEYIKRKWKKTSAVTGINYNRNYNFEFIKNQYFKYNNYTESKNQLFENLINKEKDDKIIVNFTTWKKRDKYIPLLLKYFKNQTLYPDKIICWLSEEEYKNKIPDSIQYCLDNNLLTEVRFVKGNTYGHKRYETFKYNNDAYNILIDDDIYYPNNYVEKIFKECKINNTNVVCYYSRHEMYEKNGTRSFTEATKEPSFENRYFSGLAGFPPNTFPIESFNYEYIRNKYLPKCDDSWINGWLFKNNIKVKAIYTWGTKSPLNIIGNTQEDGIYETHNGIKINGVMQAAINIANAIKITHTEEIANKLWPEFNIDDITTYNEKI